MKFFSRKKVVQGNTRKKAVVKVKVRRNISLPQPLVQAVVACLVLAGLGFGGWKLNAQLSVAYWDVDANQAIKVEIEKYFAALPEKDYWHTRASVVRDDLLQRIPDIKKIDVSRVLPDGLLIKAVAREPLALWESMDKESAVMLVDDSGQAYRPLARGESLDLPIMRLHESQLPAAMLILNQLYQRSPIKLLNLSELIVTEDQWRLNFAKGEQWQLNKTSLEQDVAQVIQILETPRWSRGYWRMDARIPQRWFIRPAKQEVI